MKTEQRIIYLLEHIIRILDANTKHPPSERLKPAWEENEIDDTPTPFPWHEVSTRSRRAMMNHSRHTDKQWPYSCDDLIAIGFTNLPRNFGPKSMNEINERLKQLGFPPFITDPRP